MYTILESLKDKELIQPIEQPETDERKIIYELTIKGKETLKIMLQKEKEIRESMKSIIGSTFGFSEDLMEEESFEFPFKKHFFGKPTGPFPGSLNGLSKDEKLETLNLRKNFISKRISALSLMLQNIEKQISELESENDT